MFSYLPTPSYGCEEETGRATLHHSPTVYLDSPTYYSPTTYPVFASLKTITQTLRVCIQTDSTDLAIATPDNSAVKKHLLELRP